MILITHDLGVVNETCDNVAVVYAGKIIESGKKYDIFKHPAHPYTNGLFGALPNMNLNSSRLRPIEGLLPDPTNLPAGCAFAPRCRMQQTSADRERSRRLSWNRVTSASVSGWMRSERSVRTWH